jgi:hypothetical protein
MPLTTNATCVVIGGCLKLTACAVLRGGAGQRSGIPARQLSGRRWSARSLPRTQRLAAITRAVDVRFAQHRGLREKKTPIAMDRG